MVNRVPWSANPTMTVKFANQGDNDESNVKVSVAVKATGAKAITVTKTIAQTKSKTTATVNIPLGQAPPAGVPATVTVEHRQGAGRDEHRPTTTRATRSSS